MNHQRKVNWSEKLNGFGSSLLRALGESPYYLSGEYNAITQALSEDADSFVRIVKEVPGYSMTNVSKAATICQMAVFDAEGGPEGDGKPKALRRHWYAWYKVRFAQPFAMALGDFVTNASGVQEIKDRSWSARLSQTYAFFVDNEDVTYKDLWVEDASRMMESVWEVLFQGCNIIVAVEKDSLFQDFVAPAKALGARSVYSGKGKSSKAAIEKVLREHYGWNDNGDEWYSPPFDSDKPLIVLHVSDHDFDGEAVIGPTFAKQARRYTDNVLEARVGVKPLDVKAAGYEWEDKWYSVKVSNKGYETWAEDKALFLASCLDCGHEEAVVGILNWSDYGTPHECPQCQGAVARLKIGESTAHGFEVEAMKTRDYYGLLVDALLRVLPFDYIVGKLRDECVAEAAYAAETVANGIFENNESYQSLLEEFDRLEQVKVEFEENVKSELEDLGQPHVGDWRDDDDDPDPGDFRNHVQSARDWAAPWRPFNISDRTRSLVGWLRDNATDTIQDFQEEVIDW